MPMPSRFNEAGAFQLRKLCKFLQLMPHVKGASMKPERFSSGNRGLGASGCLQRYSFNEAGAFQLRKQRTEQTAINWSDRASMKPERFSSGNSTSLHL